MTSTTPRQAIPYPQQTDIKDVVTQFGAMSAVADNKYVLRFFNASNRDATITSPTEGDFCYLTSEDVFTFYNGSAWIRWESAKLLRTTTTATVATTTPTQIPGLSFIAVANAVYQLELNLGYGSATTFGQSPATLGWVFPSGTTLSRGIFAQGNDTATRQAGLVRSLLAVSGGGVAMGGHASASVLTCRERVLIRIGATAGTVAPTIARISPVVSCFVSGNSSLSVRRLV